MAGLQRSSISFRRQGSSGLIWDDQFLSGDLNQQQPKDESQEQPKDQAKTTPSDSQELQGEGIKLRAIRTVGSTIERSRSNGGDGRRHRIGKVSPAMDPPSPRLSACGCCSAFGKNKSPMKKINNDDPRKRTVKRISG